jgi:hypothetical protein
MLPTPSNPSIYVYTTDPGATWPDLAAAPFPRSTASYGWSVEALGPYGSMDEAAGPQGIGVVLPRERRSSPAATARALLVPPPRAAGAVDASASCETPSVVVCNDHPTDVENREFYVLRTINRILRDYPDFASAVQITCVRTCEEARAYMKAHGEYSKTHPGFDLNHPPPEKAETFP